MKEREKLIKKANETCRDKNQSHKTIPELMADFAIEYATEKAKEAAWGVWKMFFGINNIEYSHKFEEWYSDYLKSQEGK